MVHPSQILNLVRWSLLVVVCLLISAPSMMLREASLSFWWYPIAASASVMVGPVLLRMWIMARCEKRGFDLFAAAEKRGFRAFLARWVLE